MAMQVASFSARAANSSDVARATVIGYKHCGPNFISKNTGRGLVFRADGHLVLVSTSVGRTSMGTTAVREYAFVFNVLAMNNRGWNTVLLGHRLQDGSSEYLLCHRGDVLTRFTAAS